MRRFHSIGWAMVAAALFPACASQQEPSGAEVQRTGSRLGNDSNPRTVLQVNAPDVIGEVQAHLAKDEIDEAIALAEEYIKSLDSGYYVGVNRARQRYDALNVACIALTRGGRLDDALARCTEAVELMPNQWSAFSNRGTVNYVRGDFEAALGDYQRARELVRRRDDRLTVEHNINLAQNMIDEMGGTAE